MQPRPPAPTRGGVATALAALHYAFAVLLQVERAAAAGAATTAGALAIAQADYLAASAVLGCCVWALWRGPLGRAAALALVAAANLGLIVDHAVYAAMGAHLDAETVAAVLPTLPQLADSARSELGTATWLNLALWALASLASTVPAARDRLARLALALAPPRATGVVALAGLAMVTGSVAAGGTAVERAGDGHPLLALATSAWHPAPVAPPRPAAARRVEAPPDAIVPEPAEEAARLAAVREVLAEIERPNVILVTLESVGAVQLMPDGRLDPDWTPVLAGLAAGGVTFDAVYTSTPETLRAHLQLNTGLVVTWGFSTEALAATFRGPTLAGSFQAAGYRTAFVTPGDLDFARTCDYLPPTGYDLIFDATSLAPEVREQRRVSSWGVEDAVMYERALAWVEDAAAAGRPFFLQLLTLATHHPYALPGDPAAGAPRRERYRTAMAFSDRELGDFLAALDARGLLERTIVAVTGDHGEAVGNEPDRPRELRSVRDESVRTFLVLAAPKRPVPPVSSARVASLGDIGRTLTALAGVPSGLPGRDLLAAEFAADPVYFQKRSRPTRWGVRAGRWKFIGGLGGDRHAELYDLAADPDEQENLVARHPALVERFAAMCAQWYSEASGEYAARMNPAGEPPPAWATDFRAPGPKWLGFGTGGDDFRPTGTFRGGDTAVAALELAPYGADKVLRYEWRAPDGGRRSVRVRIKPGETLSTVPCPIPLTRAAGTWRLTVWDGKQKLIEDTFAVDGTG